MMEKERKTPIPVRILALMLCIILAGTLLLLCGVSAFNYLTESESVYLNAAADASLTEAETNIIRTEIDRLAEEYSFDGESMREVFSRETIDEFGQQAALWWAGLFTKGNAKEAPAFDLTRAEEQLDADIHFGEGLRKSEIKEKKTDVLKEIRKSLENTLLPVRTQVVCAAASRLLNRFPVKSLLTVARSMTLPLLATVFCTSGLLALLTSKKLRESMVCLGGTFGAVGLVLILLTVLFAVLNIRGMIGEISGIFLRQYMILEHGLMLRIIAPAVIMLGAGIAGLVLGNRKDTAKEQISR